MFKNIVNKELDLLYDVVLVIFVGFFLSMIIDSFVVLFYIFLGGNVGVLSIYGIVNDLVVVGVIFWYISIVFIIEEGFLMMVFKEVVYKMY